MTHAESAHNETRGSSCGEAVEIGVRLRQDGAVSMNITVPDAQISAACAQGGCVSDGDGDGDGDDSVSEGEVHDVKRKRKRRMDAPAPSMTLSQWIRASV